MFVAIACLYMYFLKLHMNGRMLDIYHRLHGSQDDFFVPFDLEISNEELSYIVKKAEQWRGEEGERRKTAVYDYVWEEEQVRQRCDDIALYPCTFQSKCVAPPPIDDKWSMFSATYSPHPRAV